MFFARSPRREEEEGEQLTGDNNNTGEQTESGSAPRAYGATYEECCTSRSDYTTDINENKVQLNKNEYFSRPAAQGGLHRDSQGFTGTFPESFVKIGHRLGVF